MTFLAVAALTILTSVSAADPLEPPDLSRYLKWGPVRVRPGFAVPFFGYDDNVFSASGTTAARGDLAVRLSPRADGLVLFGRGAFLTFREQIDYVAYRDFGDLNYFENRGVARVTVPMRRLGFYGEMGHNRLKDQPVSELDTRPLRREARGAIGAILRLGWRTEADLAVVRSDWKVTDPDFVASDGRSIGQLQDRRESGVQARVRYRFAGVSRVTLDLADRDIAFDDPRTASERNAVERALLPGIEFGEGARIQGSVRAGWSRIDARRAGQPDFAAPVGDAKLAWRFLRGTTLRLDAVRRAGFAIYGGSPYFEVRSYEARVVHFLNRVIGLEGAAAKGRLSFPDSPEAAPRLDRLSKYDVGVRFRLPESVLGRRAEYTVGIERRSRDSSVDRLDQSRTVFALGVSVGF